MGNTMESQNPPFFFDSNKDRSKELDLTNHRFRIKGEFYTLRRKLGEGGFGAVWAATKTSGTPAAVKIIDIKRARSQGDDGLAWIDSFDKEVTMAYRMRKATQHVVTIFGFDFDPRTGLGLLAMELGGDTLSKRIEKLHYRGKQMHHHHSHHSHHGQHFYRKNPYYQHRHLQKRFYYDGKSPSGDYIPAADRKNFWVQLVEILQTLFNHGVIHRDLKPDNLIFFGPVMKIIDLGIAQKEILGIDPTSSGAGTPCFSAPECFHSNRPIDAKADIWSAGAILYQMTYGEPPCNDSPEPPAGIHPTRSTFVEDVLHHCLRIEPRKRVHHQWLKQHPLTSQPSAL